MGHAQTLLIINAVICLLKFILLQQFQLNMIAKTCLESVAFLFLLITINTMEITANENTIPPYFINGSRLIESNHIRMLYNWINYSNPRTQLLWRGSEHQFNWANMHQNVDNWGRILVLIKTKQNYLFGGFISKSLDIERGQMYMNDDKAFIFSLTKGTVHYQRNTTAPIIFNSKDYISFGHRAAGQSNWDDISLRWTCNIDYFSYSDFGWAFIPPAGMVPGSIQAQTYLAGSYRWMCADVEIWAVIEA